MQTITLKYLSQFLKIKEKRKEKPWKVKQIKNLKML